nr:hypothetical protein [Tanacetum cinerariifolium]
MHKAFPLPVMEFPLPGEVPTASKESSHCQKKRDATAQKIALLLKSSSNCQSKLYDSYAKLVPHVTLCILGITVIKFGDSYEAPANAATTGILSDGTGKKKGRTVTLTADDMQKRKNDVKARTTLLLSLPDEHQLRFKGSETLEQTFNRLQVIIGQLQFMDVEIEHDDLNQNGSQIKFEDINQIDEDEMKEMDIKWNMALLSMRADRFWKKTGKNISIQGTDVAGFNKSKVECFNCHKMGHFARKCRAPRSQDRGRRDNYRQGSKVEEQAPKALMAIDGVGWDWSYMANDEENHALIVDEEIPTKFTLMAKTSAEREAAPTIESSPDDGQNRNPSVTETEATPSTISPKPFIKFVKANDSPTKSKTDKVETAKKPPVKYVDKKPTKKPNVRGNQRNWNNMKSHQLGANFVMKKRACFNCGDFDHLAYDCKWVDHGQRTTILIRKFPIGSTKFSTADMGKKGNAAKASACWIWKPSQNTTNKGPNINSVSVMFKKYTYIDTQGRLNGCSRHMTGNISYLSDYEPFDRGYVSFGQGGCKITGKGTIKTDKIEFKNVYFVKDLKDFKLLDGANVLLRTPRQHNMYSIDLNNIVSHKDLTCLVAKASADEGMLWHMRLGHLNFKTINRLVRHNLVRGLPSKCFENDHTCTACLKGEQHKAS